MGGKTLISDQKNPKIHMAFQVEPTAGPLTSESSQSLYGQSCPGPRPPCRPGGSKTEQERHPSSRIPGKEGIRTATASTPSFKTCSKQTFLAATAEAIRSPRDTRPNRLHLPGLGQLGFGELFGEWCARLPLAGPINLTAVPQHPAQHPASSRCSANICGVGGGEGQSSWAP